MFIKEEIANKIIKTDKHLIGRLMLIRLILEGYGIYANDQPWKPIIRLAGLSHEKTLQEIWSETMGIFKVAKEVIGVQTILQNLRDKEVRDKDMKGKDSNEKEIKEKVIQIIQESINEMEQYT